jgi:FkbM family methyltransferase
MQHSSIIDSNLFKSQCNEDKIIYDEIFSKITIENGIYLEMGAMNGIDYSNTFFFEYYLNWTGILVEPHPFNFSNLQKNRPNNILYNNLVSNEKEQQLFMYYDKFDLSAVSGVVNTLPEKNIKIYFEQDHPWQNHLRETSLQKQYISPVTLTTIVNDSKVDHIDLFSLDVEGHEYKVLQSYDFSIPINVFLIENNCKRDVDKLLSDKGYINTGNVGPNSLYVSKQFISQHEYLQSKYKDQV